MSLDYNFFFTSNTCFLSQKLFINAQNECIKLNRSWIKCEKKCFTEHERNGANVETKYYHGHERETRILDSSRDSEIFRGDKLKGLSLSTIFTTPGGGILYAAIGFWRRRQVPSSPSDCDIGGSARARSPCIELNLHSQPTSRRWLVAFYVRTCEYVRTHRVHAYACI